MDYPALQARLQELALAAADMSDRAIREAAFATLSAETVSVEGPAEILSVVRRLISLGQLGAIQAAAEAGDAAALQAVGMLRTLRDYGETHVDLREGTAERAVLDALVPARLTPEERDAVVAVGLQAVPRWPGLREGHLQNAAAMMARAAGGA